MKKGWKKLQRNDMVSQVTSANSASYIKYTTYVVSNKTKHSISFLMTQLQFLGQELHPMTNFKFGYNKQDTKRHSSSLRIAQPWSCRDSLQPNIRKLKKKSTFLEVSRSKIVMIEAVDRQPEQSTSLPLTHTCESPSEIWGHYECKEVGN